MKFISQYNYKRNPEHYETTTPDTLTVPGDSYSVKELLIKYSQGIPVNGIERKPIYVSEKDYETLQYAVKVDRDLTDLDEVKKIVDQHEKQIKSKKEEVEQLKQQSKEARNAVPDATKLGA